MTHREPQTTELDPALVAAIPALTTDATTVEAVSGRPFLARVTDARGEWRLHRWPDGTPEARVRFAQQLAAVLRPVSEIEGRGWTMVEGIYIDREPWRPGASLVAGRERKLPGGHALHVPGELQPAAERALIHAVADLHARTALLATDRDAPLAPIDRVLRVVQVNWREARERLRPITREHPPVQRWLRQSEQLLPAAEEAIAAAAPSFPAPCVCHLDLWPGHAILNEAGEVALIDFGMATVTSPLLDVAQTVTRFAGWTGQAAERALAEYADVRQLGPEERRVLPAVAALDLAIEAARLLGRGYGRGDEHASNVSQAARAGALHLLNSMDALHSAVVRAADPVPYAKRKRIARNTSRPQRRS